MKSIVVALLMLTTPALAWDVSEMNREIDQTNFVINDDCSGTLIDAKQGYILTANHCVSQQFEYIEREKITDDGVVHKEKVRVARPGTATQLKFLENDVSVRTEYTFNIVRVDYEMDLALIRVKAGLPNTAQAKIACTEPQRGDTAFVVGNPYGVLYTSVVKGIVSSVDRNYRMLGLDTSSKALMQVSSGVIGGNSGGAVYNDAGEFIGVPVRASRINEIVGFAVPLSDVKKFLTREGLDQKLFPCRS